MHMTNNPRNKLTGIQIHVSPSYTAIVCAKASTGWLKIKYPTGEYAICLQSLV